MKPKVVVCLTYKYLIGYQGLYQLVVKSDRLSPHLNKTNIVLSMFQICVITDLCHLELFFAIFLQRLEKRINHWKKKFDGNKYYVNKRMNIETQAKNHQLVDFS